MCVSVSVRLSARVSVCVSGCVSVGEVCESVWGWGSEVLRLGGPDLWEGSWRHQRASHAEAASLAGAAGTGVSEVVPLAGLTSAWKW